MKHISNLSVQDCAPRCGSWKRKTDVFMYQTGNRGYYIGVAHRFLRYISAFVCPYRYRDSMSICRVMRQPKHGACLCKQQVCDVPIDGKACKRNGTITIVPFLLHYCWLYDLLTRIICSAVRGLIYFILANGRMTRYGFLFVLVSFVIF